ncbi:B-cell receptor CD22-like isoform X1 [Pygocentrus nattereri]|uniref:B-cell receptor CD22-like isoform X1 n=1 Tax=Pygocentrus nattereri TaxID=42514 RepID=UPI00189180E7|nr:B-cell receptor CD22-like isoform X1 [Pygocentrus nattereri]XP_037399369.1 B-cell receptor CD22-like isoform X1 [Pygocentrus nattereri]XP_037399370.1 B-cell receptor CD22-like isoform X1 [Pygocentrus nattereri]
MRSLRTAPPLPLVFLLMTAGAFGAEGSVKYNQQEICALKGSTVFMNGTFTHPEGLTVTKTFWVIDPIPGVEPTDLSKDPDYSSRVGFLTDEQKRFSLKLSDVMKKDEHWFCFRIITNEEKARWTGVPGVQLRVTELHVEAPEEVTEGQTADLTCKTTCSLTDPKFIWYKNGRPLTTKTIKNNQLHLQTVSSEDTGSYSCAVGGSQHLSSTAHSLRVRYPPKRVSVSICSSGEIVEGSSVTLTCSSDGNPPVNIYTWFKEGGTSSVGSGHSYSIISITADHTGLYYCVAQNDHGALNRTVMVTVKTCGSVVLYVVVGVSLCGNAALLTVVFWRRGKRQKRNLEERDDEVSFNRCLAIHKHTNADPKAQDDTYSALQPSARSSDDVYHTLATVQSSSPDDPYTALDPQSRSPEYDTLAVSSIH